jgi:hypothetical protein
MAAWRQRARGGKVGVIHPIALAQGTRPAAERLGDAQAARPKDGEERRGDGEREDELERMDEPALPEAEADRGGAPGSEPEALVLEAYAALGELDPDRHGARVDRWVGLVGSRGRFAAIGGGGFVAPDRLGPGAVPDLALAAEVAGKRRVAVPIG